MIERTAEEARAEIGRSSEYVMRKATHTQHKRDTILDIISGLLIFLFGVFSGVALMGGL